MKKVMVLVLLASFAQAWAQTGKMAVIDMNRVVIESNPGKVMKVEMDKLIQDARGVMAAQEEKLNAIKTQLATADDAKRATLIKQGQDAEIELKRLQEDSVKKLKAAEESSLAKIEALMTPFMKEFLKAEGITFLMNADMPSLIWSDPALDITTKVIQQYNAKNP